MGWKFDDFLRSWGAWKWFGKKKRLKNENFLKTMYSIQNSTAIFQTNLSLNFRFLNI